MEQFKSNILFVSHAAVVFCTASFVGVVNETVVRASLALFKWGPIPNDVAGMIAATTAVIILFAAAMKAMVDYS